MDTELAKKIGDAAREARKAFGLTQEDVAERAGISFEFYARIERGGTLPSVPTLVRIADALAVSADVLLGRAGPGTLLVAEPPPSLSTGEPPEVRRLVRRLRKADPRTVKLLGLIATELEERSRAPRLR